MAPRRQERTKGKTGRSDDDRVNVDESMHVEIWSRLYVYTGLLGMILARLPLPKLLQFRTICKDWKDLIDCSHFSRSGCNFADSIKTNFLVLLVRPSQFHQQHSSFMLHPHDYHRDLIGCKKMQIYNPQLDTWYRGPPTFLKDNKDFIFFQSCHKGLQLWSYGVRNILMDIEDFYLLVGRPTSTSVVQLFGTPKTKGLLSLVVDEVTCGFKVISVTTNCNEVGCPCYVNVCLHSESFDSVSNEWTEVPRFQTVFQQKSIVHAMPIVICHRVYYLLGSRQDEEEEILSSGDFSDFLINWNGPNLTLDCKEKAWRVLAGKLPVGITRSANIKIFERNGSVILAELTRTDDSDWIKSLGWKPKLYSWDPSVHPDFLTWTEIPVTIPPKEDGFQKLFYHQRGRAFKGCWCGHGDHIIFLSGLFWSHRALLYNIRCQNWTVTTFGRRKSKSRTYFWPLPVDLDMRKGL